MGFSRQAYWSGLPFPFPGDLLNPGIKPLSPALAGRFVTTQPLWKPHTQDIDRKPKLSLEPWLWEAFKKCLSGAALVTHYKEPASQCRWHGFDPWSRKTLHATEQRSPSTTTVEPLLQSPDLQYLSARRRPCPAGREATPKRSLSPAAREWALSGSEDPHSQDKNKKVI